MWKCPSCAILENTWPVFAIHASCKCCVGSRTNHDGSWGHLHNKGGVPSTSHLHPPQQHPTTHKGYHGNHSKVGGITILDIDSPAVSEQSKTHLLPKKKKKRMPHGLSCPFPPTGEHLDTMAPSLARTRPAPTLLSLPEDCPSG